MRVESENVQPVIPNNERNRTVNALKLIPMQIRCRDPFKRTFDRYTGRVCDGEGRHICIY